MHKPYLLGMYVYICICAYLCHAVVKTLSLEICHLLKVCIHTFNNTFNGSC